LSTPLERLELLAGRSPDGVDALTRAAFEAAADGLAVLDAFSPALDVVHANTRLAATLGSTVETLLGRSLLDWTDPPGAALLRELARVVRSGLERRPVEVLLKSAAATGRRMRVTFAPLELAEPGRLCLATFHDVSDLSTLDGIVETLPVELMEFDCDLVIRWANAAASRATGLPFEQLVGRRWTEVQPLAEERREIYQRVLAGEALDFECVPMTRGCGTVRYYQTSLRPVRGADGRISGLIAMGRDVTDRELARRAVEDAQRRFAAMIAASNDIIAVIGGDGTMKFESPGVERITGFRPDELVGRSLLDFLHPEDATEIRERLANVVAGGETSSQPFTIRARHRDCGYVWLESTTSNLLSDPAVGGIVVVSRDITARRAAEAAIAEGRERLELALSGAAVGTWEYDVETGEHRFDRRCVTILGREVDPAVTDQTGPAVVSHPDDVGQARAALLRHMRGETGWYETEFRARRGDGTWRWVAARGRIVDRDTDGRVRRIAGVLLDIEPRKRAERDLQTSAALLETASADGSVALWSWDLVSGERRASDSWFAMTGLSREQWLAEPDAWRDRLHPDDLPPVVVALERLMRGEIDRTAEDLEYRFRTMSGDWRWFSARVRVAERDAAGRTVRIVGRTLDVTTQKRMRQFLQETQQAAGVGGWELNLRTGELSWTDETYQIFETTRGAFTPSMAATVPLYRSQYHPSIEAAVAAATTRGEPFDITVECETLKGNPRWLRLIGKAEMIDGRAVRLYGAKQDVTELRRVDAALKKSEAELRALASNAPDWLVLLDLGMRVRFVNRSIRGLEPEQAIGVDSLAIVPGDLRDALRDAADQAIRQAHPVMVEGQLHRKSGQLSRFEFHAAPVIESAEIVGLSVRITDVTDARRAETALRTQGRMLETLREGVLLVGVDGRIQIANGAAGRMFGVGEGGTLVGRAVKDVGLDARRLRRPTKPLGESLDAPIEWLARRDDGSTFLAETAVSELRDGAERLIIAVVMDVTERKRLERAIIDASSREQQRIGQDLHDGLGQELTGISLMLRSYARRAAAEYPQGARLVDEVIDLVNHAVESARSLAHGLSPMILERGGLPAALAHVAANATRTHGLRVRFRKSLAAPLRLDAATTHHLYRIAQEAVSNAARHSGAGIVTMRLDVGPASVRLSVSDDGKGLPAAQQRRGDGLGLQIMEFRARMIHAHFRIEQPRRGGTRVSCRVPLP
jgi:two-component system CheB/CheR fusion protein